MNKSIVYFNPNGYLGGAERFVLEAATGHFEYGQDKPHILFFNDGPAVTLFKERGIPCSVLKNSFRLTRPLKVFRALKEIRQLQKRHQWNVINATMPYAHIISSLAFPFTENIKKVWYQHGPVGGILDTLASFFPYDLILFNSHYTQGSHEKLPLFRCDSSKHFLCPYGIPSSPTINSTHTSPFNSQKRVLLTAGRICSWKGYETSLMALHSLFNISPHEKERCHLYIAGDVKTKRDQPYLESLQALVKNLDLQENVTFLGRREDLGQLMANCDLYLHTSNIPEPFGLVVAEAMIQKAFVIGTNQGGTPDMLIPNKNGLSFDSTSDRAWKLLEVQLLRAFDLMDNHQQKFQQMREEAQRHIKENFSVHQMINKLEKFYE